MSGQFEEALFKYAPDAILIVAVNGAILSANPQAESMFGYTASELAGQRVERLIPDRFRERHGHLRDDYVKNPRARMMASSQELSARHKNGHEFAVEVALGPIQLDGQTVVLCIIRDISERRHAQQALQKAHDELEARVAERTRELSTANLALERSNRELQDFAYVASHDLQEPLRKIQAFGDRLKTGSGAALDAKGVEYLERMQNAAHRMQVLIQDLLAFSRVTTRTQPFQRVSLDTVLSEVLSDLVVSIEECRAYIEVERPLGFVQGDPTQLRQLLQNLVGNALKFRDKNKSEHKVRVSAQADGEGFRRLIVEDNGIGFEPRFSERIFGLFQRLHGRDEYPGSGVGLAICRKIAERHGGRLTAEGRLGQGATFIALLPDSAEQAQKGLS